MQPDYVNVIVAGKQPCLDWLDPEAAALHCARGIGVWEWAGTGGGKEPDVVLACAGDVPTLGILVATDLLRRHLPDVAVRVVNVVDLMRLQPESEHPHWLSAADFDALFTTGIQGGGDHHNAFRHGHAERPAPVPSGDGRY